LGELPESAPSTVVDARDDKPIILRDGAIPKEKIEMLFN
jgi:tRNA A37 threonylcarbamoyladenosine synthetase subunit TsaC/SUA5/YrdC